MRVNPMDVDIRLAVGIPNGEMPVMLTCPFHDDSTASLAVYRGNVHCFGCGFHLYRRYSSLVLLLGLWDGRGDENDVRVGRLVGLVRERLHEFIGEPRVVSSSVLPPLNPYLADVYHQYMLRYAEDKLVDELMFRRGLSYETIKKAALGYDGNRFTLPVYALDGSLYTIRYRTDDALCDTHESAYKKYAGTRGRNASQLYSVHDLSGLHGVEDLWVTEGEYDQLAASQAGLTAITTTNGAGSISKIPSMIADLGLSVGRWVVAVDQDSAGEEASEKLLGHLFTRGQSAVRARWDGGYKDMGDYLAAGGSIRGVRYEQV